MVNLYCNVSQFPDFSLALSSGGRLAEAGEQVRDMSRACSRGGGTPPGESASQVTLTAQSLRSDAEAQLFGNRR